MQLLTNHIGYERLGSKQAVLQVSSAITATTANLVCCQDERTIMQLPLKACGPVAEWQDWYYYQIDFSGFTDEGTFLLQVDECQSHPFRITEGLLMQRTFSDVLHYFKSQRCGGIYDKQDRNVPLFGSERTVDVRGGWYDASGDVSKYLSHLSYSNYLNPQQTPMVVWNMLKGLELFEERQDFTDFSRIRLTEEALFGADFLLRMQDPQGYFYITVFDRWSKSTGQREICAYATQDGHKSADYQAGFRQGGGIAIAALAAAARLPQGADFTTQEYQNSAETGYWHLRENNLKYLNNGEENIIDCYCALIAATELYKTTHDTRYLSESRDWAKKLSHYQYSDHQHCDYWAANSDGSRPYFHAAEAGLPAIALTQYLAVEEDSTLRESYKEVLVKALQFELTISTEVNNPFGYPRQYIKPVNGHKRSAFFVAHDNESGYWWQGENARLGSLASMAYLAKPWLSDPELISKLDNFAQHCLNWVVGLNPYDMCMLDGHGHNNPDYLPHLGFFNAKGGVCNGITAGFDNEEDIAFNPQPHGEDMLQNWRWGEQWIPHGAWYLLAIMSQFSELKHD